ncbi:replication factor C subunit 1 isoform X2 [Amyelois transitella]|uniref:replication factor C subunit 1 isoform X2 n=1 Tax=Amyelois transitella TaxID=680683 RepID=UPI00298F6B32|nr:replication factor C subunit 1 isoform X2 [Amyelois transitella]
MSADIRSFFQVKKVQTKKIEEDDDVIPESPDVQIINKKKKTKKRPIICDDSDEEIFPKKNSKKPYKEASKTKKISPPKPALKEVKIGNLFGTGPIKRTEPLVKKEKKKTETGIHSDDDFDKSLLELDVDEGLQTNETIKNVKIENNEKNYVSKESPVKDKHLKEEVKSHEKIKNKKPINGSESKKDLKKEVKSPEKNKKNKPSNNVDSESKSKEQSYSELKNEKKRKFAEFIDDDQKVDRVQNNKDKDSTKIMEDLDDSTACFDEDVEENHKSKKKRLEKSLNESALSDAERHEKRRYSAALYQNYLNRTGPKHLGAKEIPEGPPNCLKDYAFLLTGVLDSFEREVITNAITKYGGCVKNSISKKVTHVLAGEDAGPAKMAKAQELGIKIINEDQFLDMIAHPNTDKGKSEAKKENKQHKEKTPHKKQNGLKKELSNENESNVKEDLNGYKIPKKEASNKTEINEELKDDNIAKLKNISKSCETPKSEGVSKLKEISKSSDDVTKSRDACKSDMTAASLMWVDKYKPRNVKQIIGQHGDASNVKKLTNWLTKWYVNRKAKLPKPSPWAKNDDGGYYKAALLSGPPGVGKTTTVSLVCQELGFDMVEFNASDTRSKTLIKEQIGELLTTNSLSGYAKGVTGKQAVSKKHVLVMDEVDGMAGNEDRGGLQELINLIKAASVPIICMCNDRNSQKMRSLVNYCYDIRFSKPRVEQIKSAMMSICCKEGIKVPPDVLTQLIVAANQDVRQTLNLLSLWASDPELMDGDNLRRDAKNIKRDLKLGPWEAVRKVFSAEDHKTMSIHDKSDLFFYDYSLAPLFVQENYLQVTPHCPKNEILDRVSRAADSISAGDLVDARIRRSQAWSLLPLQAMYASVIPGHELSGHVSGQVAFPGWLGKNSRAGKMHRLCQEVHAHTRLSTSGSKSSIFLDYCTHLRDAVLTPLIKEKTEGVDKALETLEAYHLLRDDLDSLTELSLWPGQRNPMVLVDSKVKAALTRAYNKKATALPYAPGAIKRAKPKDDDEVVGDGDDDQPDDDEAEDSDPENDALIKKKKGKESEKASKEKAGSSKEKASSSKQKSNSKDASKKSSKSRK